MRESMHTRMRKAGVGDNTPLQTELMRDDYIESAKQNAQTTPNQPQQTVENNNSDRNFR